MTQERALAALAHQSGALRQVGGHTLKGWTSCYRPALWSNMATSP